MTDFKAKRDLDAGQYLENMRGDVSRWRGFKDGADWAARFVLEHESVKRLAEAARVVIAENDRLSGWDDLHDAWYAFKNFQKQVKGE